MTDEPDREELISADDVQAGRRPKRTAHNDLMTDRFNISAIIPGVLGCLIGLIYLRLAEAPANMIVINAAALFTGLLLTLSIGRFVKIAGIAVMALAVIGSLALLATAVLGYAIEGASRWVLIGPFFIQTSLIILPLLALGYAKTQNFGTVVAVVIAALAMAIQPDRAMAGMLCLVVLIVSLKRPTPLTIVASVSCVLAFAVTLARPDNLPAVPYVDHILWTSFEISPIAGAMLWIGCLLMISPVMFVSQGERGLGHYAFAVCWFSLIAAAAMGAYPTPLVGYGASAIIGYFLSLTLIRGKTRFDRDGQNRVKKMTDVDADDTVLRRFAV